MYSGGTVLCAVAEEFNEFMQTRLAESFLISNGQQKLGGPSTNPSTMWRLGVLLRGKLDQTRQTYTPAHSDK